MEGKKLQHISASHEDGGYTIEQLVIGVNGVRDILGICEDCPLYILVTRKQRQIMA
jgi:hypothetical protein